MHSPAPAQGPQLACSSSQPSAGTGSCVVDGPWVGIGVVAGGAGGVDVEGSAVGGASVVVDFVAVGAVGPDVEGAAVGGAGVGIGDVPGGAVDVEDAADGVGVVAGGIVGADVEGQGEGSWGLPSTLQDQMPRSFSCSAPGLQVCRQAAQFGVFS